MESFNPTIMPKQHTPNPFHPTADSDGRDSDRDGQPDNPTTPHIKQQGKNRKTQMGV